MASLFDGSDDERGAEEPDSSRPGRDEFRGDLRVWVEAGSMAGAQRGGLRECGGLRRWLVREIVMRGVKLERG